LISHAKELDLHGNELSPYIRLSASSSSRFRFRTRNNKCSYNVSSLLQAQLDRVQKRHSWSRTKSFCLSAANMSCHSGLSHLGRKESTKMYKLFCLGLSKGIICHKMLHHQKFRVDGRRWWHRICYNTLGYTQNTYHWVQKPSHSTLVPKLRLRGALRCLPHFAWFS
jgi:hypothetical protein